MDKGGFIYYAELNGEIVGTVSLMKVSDSYFELAKMAVTESAQGLGLGKLLIEHCVKEAKEKKIKTHFWELADFVRSSEVHRMVGNPEKLNRLLASNGLSIEAQALEDTLKRMLNAANATS